MASDGKTAVENQLTPIGYTLLVEWTPTVATYQNRLAPLERLEARNLLRSFYVRDEVVAGRLERAELQLRPTGFLLLSSAPIADELCVDVLGDIFESAQPKALRSMEVMLQYLVPLGAKYDEARLAGLAALRDTDLAAVGANDFAYMITGASKNMEWLIQAGIIAADEVDRRILRRVGAFRHMPSSELLLDGLSRPDVAFFCDSHWNIPKPATSGEFGDWVIEGAHSVIESSVVVMPEVFGGIVRQSVETNGGNQS